MVASRSFLLVLLLIAKAIHAATFEVTPEPRSVEPVMGTGGIVATDGDGYLVVWYSSGAWRARFVRDDGVPIGRERVLDRRGSQIAGNGDVWLVDGVLLRPDEQQDTYVRGPAISDGEGFLVYGRPAAIVKPDGRTTPVVVSAGQHPDAAWNGRTYALVGQTFSGLAVNFVDRDGRVRFDDEKVLLTGDHRNVHVIRHGHDFLAIAELRDASVVAIRFDENGALLGEPQPIPKPDRGSVSSVVQVGETDAILTWSSAERDPKTWTSTLSCPVPVPGRAGTFASNGRSVVHIESTWSGVAPRPAVLRAGSFSCDLESALRQRSTTLGLAAPEQQDPRVAATATGAAVIWAEQAGVRPSQLFGRFLTLAGEPRERIALPERLDPQAIARPGGLATDGNHFMAMWHETVGATVTRSRQEGGTEFIRAMIVSPEGMPARAVTLGTADVGVHSGGYAGSIVWTGALYIVAWTGADGYLRTARLTADGVPLDPLGGRRVDPVDEESRLDVHLTPRLFSNGTETILLWATLQRCPCDWGPSWRQVYGLVLDVNGEPTSVRLGVAAEGAEPYFPAAAWRAPYWYIFWGQDNWRAAVRRITPNGVVQGELFDEHDFRAPATSWWSGWTPVVVGGRIVLFGSESVACEISCAFAWYAVFRRDASSFLVGWSGEELRSQSIVRTSETTILRVGTIRNRAEGAGPAARLFSEALTLTFTDPEPLPPQRRRTARR